VRKNRQMIKLFFVLLFCTAFIFSSSHFGAQAFEKIKNNAKKGTTTSRGSLNVNKSQNKNSTNDPLVVKSGGEEVILTQSKINLKDIPIDLQTVIKQSSEIEIPEQSTFSLLDFVKKQKIATISSDSLSLLASGIYQSVLHTNFLIVERNIGNSLPDFVPIGFEAKVNLDQNADFVFSNPNNSRYRIQMKIVGKSLTVSLKGERFPYLYKTSLKIKQNFKPRTIIQYSPLILPGKIKVATSGISGQLIEVYKDVYQGDHQIKSDFVSEDYYPPKQRVEIHSLRATSNVQVSQPSTVTTVKEGGQAANQLETGTSSNGDQNINSSESPTQTQNSEVEQIK
jgi:hypothetical protein